jgi:tRNA threonylcarbamoyladenosine biosynthesis protein TsaB
MAILSIETSSKVCSVAVHEQGIEVANFTLFTEKSSSSLLTPIIRQILENLNIKPVELEAIAVAKGPGSYTGLRIGVSTAKGLCLALEKPLIAINTLQAMALQVKGIYNQNHLICPMLDARRMEVYCAFYDNNNTEIEPTSAKIINENSFAELLEIKNVVFLGDGADKCKNILSANKNAVFHVMPISPNANTLGVLGWESFKKQQFENLVTFEPFYLKEFVGTQGKV